MVTFFTVPTVCQHAFFRPLCQLLCQLFGLVLHSVRAVVQCFKLSGRWRGVWVWPVCPSLAFCTGCALVCILCITSGTGPGPVFMLSGVPSIAQSSLHKCYFLALSGSGRKSDFFLVCLVAFVYAVCGCGGLVVLFLNFA